MKKKLHLNSGFTLVELLVALTLVMIVIVAVVGLAAVSIKTSYRAKGGTEAKRYAEEAMEWLRQEKKTNWDSFYQKTSDSSTSYCLNQLNWASHSSCSGTISGTIYQREVKLERIGAGGNQEVKVTITVKWTDSQGVHLVPLTTILAKTE